MKVIAMIALMGNAFAQDLDFCTASSECSTTKYGADTCCSRLTYLSFSDTNNLGQFTDNVLGGEDNLVPGAHNTEICIQSAFREALEEEVEAQGYLTYYDDIRLYRESDAGLTAAFTSPEEWIEAWGADLDSMYKFIGKRECMEDIDVSNLARLNNLKNTRSKLHTLEQEVAFEMDFVLANL
jgi:hypothetical protein